jgi:hypothetical protein
MSIWKFIGWSWSTALSRRSGILKGFYREQLRRWGVETNGLNDVAGLRQRMVESMANASAISASQIDVLEQQVVWWSRLLAWWYCLWTTLLPTLVTYWLHQTLFQSDLPGDIGDLGTIVMCMVLFGLVGLQIGVRLSPLVHRAISAMLGMSLPSALGTAASVTVSSATENEPNVDEAEVPSDKPDVECSVSIAFRDVYAYCRYQNRWRQRIAIVVMATGMVTGIGLMLAYLVFFPTEEWLGQLALPLISIGAFSVVIHLDIIHRAHRIHHQLKQIGTDYVFRANAKAIKIVTGETATKLEWSYIVEAVEWRHHFFLFDKADDVLILPKPALGDLAPFRRLMRQRLGERAKVE